MPVVFGNAAADGLPARQDVWVLHGSHAGIAAALKKGMRDTSGCDLAGSVPGSFFRLSITWSPLVLPRHTSGGLTTSSCALACAFRSHPDAAW